MESVEPDAPRERLCQPVPLRGDPCGCWPMRASSLGSVLFAQRAPQTRGELPSGRGSLRSQKERQQNQTSGQCENIDSTWATVGLQSVSSGPRVTCCDRAGTPSQRLAPHRALPSAGTPRPSVHRAPSLLRSPPLSSVPDHWSHASAGQESGHSLAGCPGALVSVEAAQGEHLAASLSCRLSALSGSLSSGLGLPALAESAPRGLLLGDSEGGREASKTALWWLRLW